MQPANAYTIRQATEYDALELSRLAELDSEARELTAPLLLGERGGEVIAAISLEDGRVIANPFLMLRGRALRRYVAVAIGGVLVFVFLALAARPLQIEVDSYLAFVTLGVLIVAACWAFVALSPAEDVRWSATRAALAAGVLYLAIIPLMLRTPIDGDEPYYVLITESMVGDHDLDLANQYRDLAHSATGRTDLTPQLGDPVGPRGELYSRHEPFLPLLLIPGYLLGGLGGAIATIARFIHQTEAFSRGFAAAIGNRCRPTSRNTGAITNSTMGLRDSR